MEETPKTPDDQTSEMPPMGGAVEEQTSTNAGEAATLPDLKKRDDAAIRKAREKRAQMEQDERTRKAMARSKIDQTVVSINPGAVEPSKLPPFLEQPKQAPQDSIERKGPNAVQKFIRKILGVKD